MTGRFRVQLWAGSLLSCLCMLQLLDRIATCYIQYLDSTQHVRPKFFQRTGEQKRSEPMIPVIALEACEELVDCLDVIHKCNDAACKHKHNGAKDAYAVEADEWLINKDEWFWASWKKYAQVWGGNQWWLTWDGVVVLKIRPGHNEEDSWDPINEWTIHETSFSY